jgi:hypothetical protein
VLVSGFMTWALFGIQEIGLLIEDPFQVKIYLNDDDEDEDDVERVRHLALAVDLRILLTS